MTVDSATLSALAEPTRLHIIELLRQGPFTVGEIALRLQIRQPQASKHLRVLSDAGLVEAEAIANRRIYRLRVQPFQDLDDWIGSYRSLWADRFDQLDTHLQRLQQPNSPDAPPPLALPTDP
ncbi:helix-turn-helix transcriptional regulator [Deinococcus sp. QL22]|uniref:ArsR/SmtB family transcription factor n=1 Tax=Deinococcus sp. QL22 TaxID=2939437 RepID=UPI002016BCE0|nr:metalloregulator ArsR/SmtB family transcription factor [Deinococcus sp. QL22]UQN09824.1 metalloregulator ArsR/SmtB family transcription factor [Deinococcus sp. QL22]